MNGSSNRGMRPRVVEIIGPAGVGKTTLYQALRDYSEFIRLDNFPNVRNVFDAPFFIWNGLRSIPDSIRLYRTNSRQLSRREFAWLTILRGWGNILRRDSIEGKKTIILDQGPVYLMAEMQLFGPAYLGRESAERFWQDVYRDWSSTLDMLVWLDASNDVLLDRIRVREQEHPVKAEPDALIYQFLDRYRAEYEYLLSVLMASRKGLRVLQFDTGRQQPNQIVDQLHSELHS